MGLPRVDAIRRRVPFGAWHAARRQEAPARVWLVDGLLAKGAGRYLG